MVNMTTSINRKSRKEEGRKSRRETGRKSRSEGEINGKRNGM